MAGSRIIAILRQYQIEDDQLLVSAHELRQSLREKAKEDLRKVYYNCLKTQRALVDVLEEAETEDLKILTSLLVDIEEGDVLHFINIAMQFVIGRAEVRGSAAKDGDHQFDRVRVIDSNYDEQAVNSAYLELLRKVQVLESHLDKKIYPEGCDLKSSIDKFCEIPEAIGSKVEKMQSFYQSVEQLAKKNPTPDLVKFAYITALILVGAGIILGTGPVISYEAAEGIDVLVTLAPAAISRIRTGTWQFWKNPVEKLETIAKDKLNQAQVVPRRPTLSRYDADE